MLIKKLPSKLALAALVLHLAACGDKSPETPSGDATAPIPKPMPVQGAIPQPRANLARAASNGTAKCNLEWLQGKSLENAPPTVVRAEAAEIVGWYADMKTHSVGTGVELVIHDASFAQQWSVVIDARRSRKDVANALGDPTGMLGTGLKVPLNLSGLPAGQYGIYLRDSRGDESICGLGRSFILQ